MTDPVIVSSGANAGTRNEEVHFYPGSKLMVYLVGKKVEVIAEAWGGPSTQQPKRRGEKIAAGPTTPGVFVIDHLEAYRTDSWQWSKIPWGTPIRGSRTDTRKLEYLSPSGKWKPSTITLQEEVRLRNGRIKSRTRLLNTMDVMRRHADLRGSFEFPDTWLFNDFGPIAVRYFDDKNHNRRLDAKERLSGEMIHTTPNNEAESDTFKDPSQVHLFESHGCIHIKPIDRKRFIDKGAFRKGMTLIIHSYDEIFNPDNYE